ncbi:MAG TPA: hypothetical protein VF747_05995, partial [Blastocatellia bacterium]|jgi:hypothetical protein
MSSKMQILFVKQTGHVLAAFTRTADPEGKPSIEALAGDGLIFRNRKIPTATSMEGETFLIAPEMLDLAVVDFNTKVFVSPLDFAAGGGKAEPLGSLTPTTVALAQDKLKISVGTPIVGDLKVWAQVVEVTTGGDSKPVTRVMEGKIEKSPPPTPPPPPPGTVELLLTITPGGTVASIPANARYYVMALVEGQSPVLKTEILGILP